MCSFFYKRNSDKDYVLKNINLFHNTDNLLLFIKMLQDCASELLWLFAGHCLPGPFGGMISLVPDYVCSAQSADNAPDWFPFLCVTSPPENNPYLGLFYDGTTVYVIKFLFFIYK